MITVTSIKRKILFAFLQTISQKNFRQFLFDDFFINRGIRTVLIFELQHSYTVFLQTLQSQLYSIHHLVDINVRKWVRTTIGLLLYITIIIYL